MPKTKSLKNTAKKLGLATATLALLGYGVGKGVKNISSRNKDKQEQTKPQLRQDFVSKAMQEYYPELFVSVEYLETNRQTPVKQTSEARCTYWNGLTWVYTVDKNGNIEQHPCTGKWKNMAAKLTSEQREEQFRLHLRYETFKRLESVTSGKKHIDHRKAMGLCMAGYQLPGHMTDIATRLEKAKNTQEIMDAFKYKLPKGEIFRKGTLKRRWWCGAYAAGLITMDDILELEKDGFSKVKLSDIAVGIGKDKQGQTVIKHFKYDKETVAKALRTARAKGDKKTVREVLNKSEHGREVLSAVQSNKKMDLTILYSEAKYQKDYEAAVAEFNAGNYKNAIKKYDAMLKDFPNDGLVLNDMAAAYNELGQYDKALECTSKIFNKSKDRTQYGAAYYNAGVAREKLGEYKSALANYKNAQKHGNKSKAVKEAIARLQSLAAKMTKNAKKQEYMAATQKLNAHAKARTQKAQNARLRASRTYHI